MHPPPKRTFRAVLAGPAASGVSGSSAVTTGLAVTMSVPPAQSPSSATGCGSLRTSRSASVALRFQSSRRLTCRPGASAHGAEPAGGIGLVCMHGPSLEHDCSPAVQEHPVLGVPLNGARECQALVVTAELRHASCRHSVVDPRNCLLDDRPFVQ